MLWKNASAKKSPKKVWKNYKEAPARGSLLKTAAAFQTFIGSG